MGDFERKSEYGLLQNFTNIILHKVTEEDNYLISPLCIEIVLGMIYQGTSQDTAIKLASILKVTEKKPAADKYKYMIEALHSLKHVTLDMANKIYIKKNCSLKNNFKKVIHDAFMSRIDMVNFTKSEKTAKAINQWVESKTNKKIKDIITANCLTGLTCLILVNALYFKGDWAHPFKPEDTKTEPFYVDDDETVECEMMFLFSYLKTYENDKLNATLVELPYRGEEASMIIILPNEYDGIAELEKQLASTDLSTLMDENVGSESIEVFLPKFKIETTTDVKPLLEKIGMGDMFDSSADFTEICENPDGLHISEFIQKTYIDVNEKGTEAASANRCGIMLVSGPKRFTADHPFMFMLQTCGEHGNSILFIGKVVHPANYSLPF